MQHLDDRESSLAALLLDLESMIDWKLEEW
jgi:hypothetical protein